MSNLPPSAIKPSQQVVVQWTLVAATILAAVGIGALQVRIPFVGPGVILAAYLLPVALAISGTWLAVALLTSVLFSRVLTLAGAPALVNYVHFLIALIALAKIVLPDILDRRQERIASQFSLGLVVFSLAIVASAVVNGWLALKPVLLWLTLIEPFILLRLFADQDQESRKTLRLALIVMSVIQLPFAFWQFSVYGGSDPVQGTLIGLGSGAHTMSAICVMGGLLLVSTQRSRMSWFGWPIVIALFAVGMLADAKQVYGALVVAGVPFVIVALRSRQNRGILPVAMVFGVVLLAGARFVPALDRLVQTNRIDGYFDTKIDAVRLVTHELGPLGMVFGAGPGNGTSRVALLNWVSPSGATYGSVPTVITGDENSQLAIDVLSTYGHDQSSADSLVFSWLGIVSDIGLIGLLAYLLLVRWVWFYARGCFGSGRILAQFLLIFAATLGMIFSWLEEPAFVLFLVAVITALPRGDDGGSPSQPTDKAGGNAPNPSPHS